jgi:hypothetical protein
MVPAMIMGAVGGQDLLKGGDRAGLSNPAALKPSPSDDALYRGNPEVHPHTQASQHPGPRFLTPGATLQPQQSYESTTKVEV